MGNNCPQKQRNNGAKKEKGDRQISALQILSSYVQPLAKI